MLLGARLPTLPHPTLAFCTFMRRNEHPLLTTAVISVSYMGLCLLEHGPAYIFLPVACGHFQIHTLIHTNGSQKLRVAIFLHARHIALPV